MDNSGDTKGSLVVKFFQSHLTPISMRTVERVAAVGGVRETSPASIPVSSKSSPVARNAWLASGLPRR